MNKYQIPEGSLISFMSDKVKHFGGINLAQGLPGFSPPVALLDFLSEISTDISLQQYAPGNGDKRLLELIYSHYSKFSNYKQDNFVVVNGATEAISIIFTYIYNLIDKPYSVLAFNPAYESYINLPKIFNLPYIPFSFEDDLTIDFNKLEDTIKKEKVKLLFVNTPGNPLGKIWSENEINKIIELAEKLDVYIILDAVYKEIYFDKPPYLPYNYTGNRVFYVNSFSKLLSITGWRIGYFYAGDTHIRKLKTIHDYIGLCSPSLLQKAIAGYIDNNDFGITYSAGLRQKINISFKLLHTALINKGFKIRGINGGYFIWTELPFGYDDCFKFTIDLYEQEKVAVIPGIHFDRNARKFIRFNIARPVEDINTAIERLNRFLA